MSTPFPVDPASLGALGALLESTRQSLSAFQSAQERTAQVHAEFLKAHALANESFSTLFGTHARLVERALGRIDVARLGQAIARAAAVDRLAKGLRAPQADSDPWLELTDLALELAH